MGTFRKIYVICFIWAMFCDIFFQTFYKVPFDDGRVPAPMDAFCMILFILLMVYCGIVLKEKE